MSNWREDKKFVENFMKKNHETSTNYFHVMNKTNKNTWNEMANDLRRQIDAVKKMKQNIDEFEAEQAAETRRRAEEIPAGTYSECKNINKIFGVFHTYL